MKDKYNALIIGAGNIASKFDTPEQPEILTHAHAYSINPRISFGGFFDKDFSQAQAAASKWQTQAFGTLDQACRTVRPDIVSICTPDIVHAESLLSALPYKPQLVICEKPVTTKVSDSQQVQAAYAEAGIPVLINYSRRFDTSMQKLKQEIEEEKYGKVLGVQGKYVKGVLHSGSHLIDLCRYLFGNVRSAEALYRVNDVSSSDPSIACFLTFALCPQALIAVGDARQYEVFELQIDFEKQAVAIRDFGRSYDTYERQEDKMYKGFFGLVLKQHYETKLSQAVQQLIQHAVDHLDNNQVRLLCGLEDAIETQKVCADLLESINK